MIFDSIISIQRLKRDSGNNNKESYQINEALEAVSCQLQPASSEQTAMYDGIYGQTFTCFTMESGILTGDRVTISGTGEYYRVRGIEDWSMDDAPHYEITMVRMEEEEVQT